MFQFVSHLGVLTQKNPEDGASAVEHGLLLVGIAALIAAVVFLFGESVFGLFTGSCDSFEGGSGGHLSITC